MRVISRLVVAGVPVVVTGPDLSPAEPDPDAPHVLPGQEPLPFDDPDELRSDLTEGTDMTAAAERMVLMLAGAACEVIGRRRSPGQLVPWLPPEAIAMLAACARRHSGWRPGVASVHASVVSAATIEGTARITMGTRSSAIAMTLRHPGPTMPWTCTDFTLITPGTHLRAA